MRLAWPRSCDSINFVSAKTILQIALMNETGDSMHRMRWPAAELSKQMPEWCVVNLDAHAKERYEWGLSADLLVLFQSMDLDMLPVIAKRREQGRATLVEYNDNFYEPPAWSPVAGDWQSPLLWQSYELFMEEADGIIVTGIGLYELFKKKRFSNLHILRNHFPYTPEPFEKLWPKSGEIRIGWAGSLGHMADLLALLPSMRALIETHKQIKFCLMGNESIPSFLHMPQERVEFRKWGSMDEYFSFLKSLHIGIVPQLATPYNDCRSDIKAVEYAGCGVLPLLQERLPYQEFIRESGSPSFSSWQELDRLLAGFAGDPESACQKAKQIYEYVRTNRLLSEDSERCDLYSSLLKEGASPAGFGLKPGYHEVLGSKRPEASFQQILKEAQLAIDANNLGRASKILEQGVSENPLNFHLVHAFLRCEGSRPEGNRGKIKDLLRLAKERFRNDLRFNLIEIASEQDAAHVEKDWLELAQQLASLNQAQKAAVFEDVLKLFLGKKTRMLQSVLQIGEALLEQFPERLELAAHMAELHDLQGSRERARDLFGKLVKDIPVIQSNKEFAEKTQQAYFLARYEGLRGGLDNS
ncbi:MAG: hypothetical protein DCC75_09730 [Proteobacteria bacterium]|nr:MAG: hypothetical protein DCC75_09730 [Pseudomonadota bacterium]